MIDDDRPLGDTDLARACLRDGLRRVLRHLDEAAPRQPVHLADGGLTLPCLCDTHDCPATETTSASPASGAHTVIHVLPDPPNDDAEAAEQAGATTTAATGGRRVVHLYPTQSTLDGAGTTPALLAGYGALPAAALRDLATRAAVRHLRLPTDFGVEDHYRPSAALADCIRARDLTCRFPGCDHPAESCDIDHTIRWPAGPTHPANLKLLCRTHK
ncbi:HNH endonuclease [Mycobacterium sp. PS03-16]|nr:HNH endonuclease [Mycobacterium sp. PS03-16]